MVCQRVGLCQDSATNFPSNCSAAGCVLARGAGASWLVSGFLTKGTGPSIVVEMVSLWEKEGLVLPILPSCWCYPRFSACLTYFLPFFVMVVNHMDKFSNQTFYCWDFLAYSWLLKIHCLIRFTKGLEISVTTMFTLISISNIFLSCIVKVTLPS